MLNACHETKDRYNGLEFIIRAGSMRWSELAGSSTSLAMSSHLADISGLVLTPHDADASLIANELCYFSPSLKNRVIYLPEREALPFDLERPSASILSQRAFAFYQLSIKGIDRPVIVSSVRNAMTLHCQDSFWSAHLVLSVGQTLPSDLVSKLAEWGYTQAFRTKSPGQFSMRGRVIDIFPVGGLILNGSILHRPLRVRFNQKGVIDQIKKLDSLTQESSRLFDQAMIFPMRDYDPDKTMINAFRSQSYDFNDDPRSNATYKQVSQGLDHPELMWWVSQASHGATHLLEREYDAIFIVDEVIQSAEDYGRLIDNRHADVRIDPTRIVPSIDKAFLEVQSLREMLNRHPSLIRICSEYEKSFLRHYCVDNGVQRKSTLKESLAALRSVVQEGGNTLFVIKSDVRQKHMELMTSMMGYDAINLGSFNEFHDISQSDNFDTEDARIFITRGDLAKGYHNKKLGYRIITEREIFGSVVERGLEDELNEHQRRIIIQGLHEIEQGEPLVHALLGVGRFAGFENLNISGIGKDGEDVVKVAYADDAATFVRIRDLDLVSRYSGGAPDKAPLSKLNDPSWRAGVLEAQMSAYQVAADLVKLKASRDKSVGITLKPADSAYDRFCEVFIYEETLDQKRAINDIMSDLMLGKPMDRLICGDVGVGKTEVAMRAAFMAAHQGYQVVLLAPTTILAEQHYRSFISRFEETSIKIMLANRNSLSKRDLQSIKEGEASIIVGTHRLLQSDIEYDNLGLIIVDEEHRFGVKQKEMLREIRGNKHMLTLSATPIPRTLGMAMSGIRDVSIIATAPASRLSVRTLVMPMSDDAIRLALSRELSRSGQAFYLHNRIESMDDCVARIERLLPDARVRKIHGKQSEMDMAKTMFEFKNHEFDILVSTTVIEIGIDIPNANTILIEDADNLGLAQLHQLRGRVGRSSRQAFAYLMHNGKVNSVGMSRLKAMEKASNLGEGLLIARHDMEIRGIGEILGEDQSGHIHNIGFTLYMRLLEQAIKAISEGRDLDRSRLFHAVDMPLDGSIPTDFIGETGERLAWYQRLISSEDEHELARNKMELEDLYGYLPIQINTLMDSIRQHILLREWGIRRVEEHGNGVMISLNEESPKETRLLISLSFRNVTVVEDKKATALIANHTTDSFLSKLSENIRTAKSG